MSVDWFSSFCPPFFCQGSPPSAYLTTRRGSKFFFRPTERPAYRQTEKQVNATAAADDGFSDATRWIESNGRSASAGPLNIASAKSIKQPSPVRTSLSSSSSSIGPVTRYFLLWIETKVHRRVFCGFGVSAFRGRWFDEVYYVFLCLLCSVTPALLSTGRVLSKSQLETPELFGRASN